MVLHYLQILNQTPTQHFQEVMLYTPEKTGMVLHQNMKGSFNTQHHSLSFLTQEHQLATVLLCVQLR
jgi:hypothetical protein